VQSFSRLDAEVLELRQIVERLLAAQMPVLSWWALANILTRTATTLTVLAIIVVGTLLHINGQATIGEMVTFMNFAALIITRLEQSVGFINKVMSEAPRLREFFQVWDTVPAIRDTPDAVDPGPLARSGRVQGRVVHL
jgi:ABC-type multidrug transport system fused ATPase/permease subunit